MKIEDEMFGKSTERGWIIGPRRYRACGCVTNNSRLAFSRFRITIASEIRESRD